MGNSDWNPDRANPLRSLSRTLAGWQAKVLQRPVQDGAPYEDRTVQGGDGEQRGADGDPLDLTNRCEYCDIPLPEGSHPTRMFCSVKCRNAKVIAIKSAELRAARSGRICPQCGGPVSDDKPAYTKYCSEACQAQGYAPHRQYRFVSKTCPVCGSAFETRHKEQVKCSKSCVLKHEWASGKRDHLHNRLSAARFDAMFIRDDKVAC